MDGVEQLRLAWLAAATPEAERLAWYRYVSAIGRPVQ